MEALGRMRLRSSRFLDTVGTVMGRVWCREFGHANGEGDTFYINTAWGAAINQKGEGYHGRRGDGDKTTFEHTQTGRHKYSKPSRWPGLKGGRYTSLIKTMSFYGELERVLRSH